MLMLPRPPVTAYPVERIWIKRIYQAARASDGKHILVDRVWPRDLSRDFVRLPVWCKEIVPSDGPRHWFHAHAELWMEFGNRYQTELAAEEALDRELTGYAFDGVATLLYGSRNEAHNSSVVLRDHLHHLLEQAEDRYDRKAE